MGHVLAEQMAEEAADGGQAAITGSHGVPPLRFQMGQEIGNRLDLQIIRLQIGHRAALGVGQVEEKQP
jgi:hypothetical protein